MIRACLLTLLSHWRRNPIQLYAYLAGLALATALWSGVQAINTEARASYAAAAAKLGQGRYDQLVPRRGDTIPQDIYIDLRRAGWLVSPVIEGRLNGVRLLGIDPITSPAGFIPAQATSAPQMLDFAEPGRVFAGQAAARDLNGIAPVSVDLAMAPGIAVGDIGTVQTLLQRQDLSRLILLPDQPIGRADLASVAPQLRVQSSQQSADVGELTDSFHLNLTAFGLLSFAVGLFIVHSTIGLAFEQRRGMIRTMRSLGVPLRTLVWIITAEMLMLAMIGAGLGILFGYLIAAVLLPDVAATVRGLYGADISGTLRFRAEWWLSGLLIALLGTIAALFNRIWQIAHMPLLASVRPRAWAMAASQRVRFLMIGSVALLSAALLLATFGDGLTAGFVLLGCLLIGAALALPILVERALSYFQKITHAPVWSWFWADTRQQLPGLSLALMALLLAVSANIGVATMVSSFRLTFVAFLDQRLAPELFIQVETQDQGAQLEYFLRNEGIEVLPLLSTQANLAGQPAKLYGVRVGPTYREKWAFLASTDDAWDQVEAGRAAVLNEQLARRANRWVGDRIEIAPDLTLPIAAVVGDYGNPHGQAVISEIAFQKLHPEIYPLQFGIRTHDVAKMRTAISDAVGIPTSAMVNQSVIKEASLAVFERTFTVTAALNALTLFVAGFALLMSLLTLADLRVPQLAPVWALGLTRRTLSQLELLRAVVLAALVFVCAIPLGLALAWVLLSIINVEAFGWRLPMYFFPADYLRLGAYALIAAAVAALWPALRLMRTPPSTLLKVFANER